MVDDVVAFDLYSGNYFGKVVFFIPEFVSENFQKACIYIYIYIYIYIRVVQKVVNFTKILDLSFTFHLWMGFTWTEIKTDIWISFSSFVRKIVLPHNKNVKL